MNKKTILGICIIIIGILLGLKSLDIIKVNIFFEGWWTLFLIIPSLHGLIVKKKIDENLIGLIVGVLLLLAVRDIINFNIIWKLLIPIIIVITGINIIFKEALTNKITKNMKKLSNSKNNYNEINATFTEQKIDYTDEEFNGATINSIFGNTRLDLKNAKIKKDTIIEVTNIFGGTTILAPQNIKVISKHSSIFGGETNYHKKKDIQENPVIYINSTNIFGGITIK